jgi:CRISPR-associated protein Cas2
MIIGETCKNFGLSRIQKSAFLGYLSSSKRKDLKASLKRILGNAKGNIQIFQLCNACLALREIIGDEIIQCEPSIVII